MSRETTESVLDILMSGGMIEIYSGPRPESPEDKLTGKLLLHWEMDEGTRSALRRVSTKDGEVS